MMENGQLIYDCMDYEPERKVLFLDIGAYQYYDIVGVALMRDKEGSVVLV